MAHRGRPVDPVVKLSKALSYLLRHGAEKRGFTLLPGGFLYVEDIMKDAQFQQNTISEIQHVVDNNDKKRFALETDQETGKLKIRANQGHSLQVEDLELTPITNADDFPVVIHGTYQRPYKLIEREGLRRMNRNHIHFAAGEPGQNGVISGMRQSCSVIIYVDLHKALQDGLQFFLSTNNVILCPGNVDGVLPTSYFSKVIERRSGKTLLLPASTRSGAEAATCPSPSPCIDEEEESNAVSAEEIADEFDKKKKRKQKAKHQDL